MSEIKKVKIKEVVDLIKDKSKIDFYPYIEIGDIDLNTKKYLIKDKKAVKGSIFSKFNDILISKVRPTRGAMSIVEEEFVSVSNGFVVLRIKEKVILNKYLFYVLSRNNYFFKFLGSVSKGATYPTCSDIDVLNFEIPLPPLEIQQKIVEKLDKIEELRSKKKEAIEKMNNLIPALFIKMFGDPVSNPMGWEVKKLNDICTLYSGGTPSTKIDEYWNGSVKWASPAELSDDNIFIFDTKNKISELGYKKSSAKIFPKNTVLLSSRAPIGKTAIAMDEMCTNQGFKSMYPNSSILNSYYLLFWLRFNKNFLNSLGSGATFKEISMQVVKDIKIMLPNIDLQNKFADYVQEIEKQKDLLKESSKKLDDLFNSTLQEVFSE